MDKVIGIGMIVFFIFIIGACTVSALNAQTCLRAGYPNSQTTFFFEGFCAREENEYEIVVPISELP